MTRAPQPDPAAPGGKAAPGVAPRADPGPQAFQVIAARVLRLDEAGVTLALPAGEIRARRAFSCLVEPQPEDRVLAAVGPDGAAQVLAILDRPGLGDARLSVPDPAARLAIAAQSLDLEAATRVRLTAPEITLATRALALMATTATWIGDTATFAGKTMNRFLRRDLVVADRMAVRTHARTTEVAGVDTADIATEVVRIGGAATRTGGTQVVAMRDDLRPDAERITMA